jgi:hypothetical protein
MRRVLLLVPLALSCAPILGGLEEGQARDAGAVDAAPIRSKAPACDAGGWLPGFGYRVPVAIMVEGDAGLPAFSTQIGLGLDDAIAAKKARADLADLRVTAADGTTIAPHYVTSATGARAIRLWAKLDLSVGENDAFIYYGNDDASSTSDRAAALIDGIVRNPRFDQGNAPWFTSNPTSGGVANFSLPSGAASVEFARDGAATESAFGWCQSVVFPPGRSYRLGLRVLVSALFNAIPRITVGGTTGTVVWSESNGVGASVERSIETGPIEAGTTILCLGGVALPGDGAQRLKASYSDLYVRAFHDPEPLADAPGNEERACSVR